MSKDVLIFVHINTHFRELIRVATLLAQTDRYRPVVFFNREYEGWEDDVERCTQGQIEVLTHATIDVPPPAPPAPAEATEVGAEVALAPGQALPAPSPPPATSSSLRARLRQTRLWPLARAARRSVQVGINESKGWLRERRNDLFTVVRNYLVTPRPLGAVGRAASLRITRLLLPVLSYAWSRAPKLLPRALLYVYREGELGKRLFRHRRYALLVLPEDNLFYQTHMLIEIAREHGCPTVIIPFTIVNAEEWAEGFYLDPASTADTRLNHGVATLFPQWVYAHKGKRLIFPPQHVLAAEFSALRPPIPWLINSGGADKIAAESPFMNDYYLAAGLPASQLVLTGALYDDELHQRLADARGLRRALYASLGLEGDKPMLLVGLPPDQLMGHGRPDCDFARYEDIVRFWAETLGACADSHHVIVNLHPRTALAQVQFMADYGVHFCHQNIAQLVPLCSLYVACVSATIRMAIACGHPVVNYDVYRYGYEDYASAQGIITVQEKAQFVEAVRRLTGEPAYFESVQAQQQADMQHWAVLDGRSGERMLELFDDLTANAGG